MKINQNSFLLMVSKFSVCGAHTWEVWHSSLSPAVTDGLFDLSGG